PRSRCFAIALMPRSSASGTGSWRSVLAPARQASCAIPAPIVPAPATPIVLGECVKGGEPYVLCPYVHQMDVPGDKERVRQVAERQAGRVSRYQLRAL